MNLPISFLWPQYLWLLLALPVLVLLYLWLLGRKKKNALRYASLSIVREAMGPSNRWRRHVPPAMFLVAVGAMLLAVSRPLATITLPSNQATVILAIDVSLSMRATDVKPNRMIAAQEAAKAFLKDMPKNVRVGIVTFAGTAQVVQRPTQDKDDLIGAIDRFQMQYGTAIGNGIIMALSELFPDEGIDLGEITYGTSRRRGKSLDDQPKKVKKEFIPVPPGSYESAAIIMLTDGRRTTGVDTQEAAKMAADHGVRVYSIGLGTVDGVVTGFDGWSMYLKLDEPALKAVATATNAEYFYAGDADALKKVYEKLSARLLVEKRETEITSLLALAAAVLVAASAALSMLWFNRLV